MKKRVAIYLRFSDPKQIGNTSFDVQRAVCHQSCEVEDFEIVDTIENEAKVIGLVDCSGKRGSYAPSRPSDGACGGP